MTTGEVLLQYQQRIGDLRAALDAIQYRQATTLTVAVVAVLIALGCGIYAYSRRSIPLWYPPMAMPTVLLSIRKYGRLRLRARRLTRLRAFYNRGQERLAGDWAGKGHCGNEFQPADHPYAADLGLFGEGSLFERICTARTHLGQQRLARFLTEPAAPQEALDRQTAIRELMPATDLREQIGVLGEHDFEESKWRTFAEWLDAPSLRHAEWLRRYFLVSSTFLLVMSVAVLTAPSIFWPILWRPILATVAIQGIAGAYLLRWVRSALAAAGPVAHEIRVMREGLALLARQKFAAPKLAALVQRAGNAGQVIGELDPWFLILGERTKDWYYQLSLLLALGTQTALAMERWRDQHRTALLDWLDTWAEFEALNALAGYAYENPEDCWPEISGGDACFEASALGHPLLPRETCVRNDVTFGSTIRFWVISGSNMSGKSTLLRSIGLASVLALAGAPVRAKALRMAAMAVYASISVGDSLRDGKSRFLAEVQRLRDTLEASLQRPVLFLIDEIFSGTNSRDRQSAADAVVRTLVVRKAVGAVSTHDITLASIADHGGMNVHMASSGKDPLDFDYRLKQGITPETNAIAIARMAGVPV